MRAPVLLELPRNLLDQSNHLQHVSDTQHPGDLTVEWKDVGFVDLAGDGVQVMKSLQVLNVGDAEVRLTKLDLCLAQHRIQQVFHRSKMHHLGPPDFAGYMDERLDDNPRNEDHHTDCAQPDAGEILNAEIAVPQGN